MVLFGALKLTALSQKVMALFISYKKLESSKELSYTDIPSSNYYSVSRIPFEMSICSLLHKYDLNLFTALPRQYNVPRFAWQHPEWTVCHLISETAASLTLVLVRT